VWLRLEMMQRGFSLLETPQFFGDYLFVKLKSKKVALDVND
jgi:hypothetical protein